MNLRRLTATAVLVVAALGVGTGTSVAQPASENKAKSGIDYVSKLVDKTVVTTLDGGTFKVSKDGKAVDINDKAGHAVVQLPLSFKLDDVSYPLAHKVKNNSKTLELTPPKDVKSNGKPLFVKPVASVTENQDALNAFSTQFAIATAVGGFVGTGIGAVIGGLLIGIPACLATFLVACVPGITAGAAVGGIAGTVAVGGPALMIAGIDLIQTMTAPDGTTKWASDEQKAKVAAKATPQAVPAPAPAP